MPDLFEALSIIAAKRFAEERGARDDAAKRPAATDDPFVLTERRPAAVDTPGLAAHPGDERRRRVLGWTR